MLFIPSFVVIDNMKVIETSSVDATFDLPFFILPHNTIAQDVLI